MGGSMSTGSNASFNMRRLLCEWERRTAIPFVTKKTKNHTQAVMCCTFLVLQPTPKSGSGYDGLRCDNDKLLFVNSYLGIFPHAFEWIELLPSCRFKHIVSVRKPKKKILLPSPASHIMVVLVQSFFFFFFQIQAKQHKCKKKKKQTCEVHWSLRKQNVLLQDVTFREITRWRLTQS